MFYRVSILIFFTAIAVFSQTITLLRPSAGDTIYIGDTIHLEYDYDEAFSYNTGTVVKFSHDAGLHWFFMNPLQSEFADGMIALKESWAKAPKFILKPYISSIIYKKNGVPEQFPTVSNEAMFSVLSYSEIYHSETECCITVLDRNSAGSLVLNSRHSASAFKVALRNRSLSLVSPKAGDARVMLYTLGGKTVVKKTCTLTKGKNSIQIDRAIPAGTILCSVEVSNEIEHYVLNNQK